MPRLQPIRGSLINPSITAPGRLALISQHLTQPQSVGQSYSLTSRSSSSFHSTTRRLSLGAKPSSTMASTQPPHPTLLIPGPIEFDDAVLQSMSHFR